MAPAVVPLVCAALVVLVALLALVGWVTDTPGLTGRAPGLPAMKPNTALALIAAATALVLLRAGSSPRARRVGGAVGAAVAIFGMFVCVEYVVGGTGVDTLLVADTSSHFPGRPALPTALALITIGGALATDRSFPPVSVAFVTATLVMVLFTAVGYVYGVDFLRGGSGHTGVALPTLGCLTLLATGLVCLDPGRGLLGVLRGEDAGAQMARVMLPVTVGAALLFGSFGYWLETHAGLSLPLADAIYTLATALALATVVILIAGRLRRYDRHVRTFAAIVESAQDGIITNTLDGTITSWNAAAERIYGYAADEVIGTSVAALAPPELADEPLALLQRVRRGEAVEIETRRIARDGRLLDVALTVSPMHDAAGDIVEASTIVRDITEEKRREADRRRLAVVVDSSADAIVSIDNSGRFTSWNTGAEKLLGWTADEVIGRPVTLAVPEDVRGEFATRMAKIEAGESIVGWETSRRRKDGELVDVEITVSPLADAAGEFTGATAIMRNIGERKEAERRLETVLEAAPDGMIIVDDTGTMVQVNAEAERLFGYDRTELIGEPVEMLVPEDVRRKHAGLRVGYSANPHARMMGMSRELLGCTRDGAELPVEVSLSPLETAEGLLVIAAVRDVTERRNAERALADSEELFRRSFEDSGVGMALVGLHGAGLGHVLEVNEALAAITGYPEDELRAMEPLATVHPDDVAGLAEEFVLLLAGELAVVRREARLIASGGDVLWAAMSIALVRDSGGTPVHAVVQVQDVTERKRFEGQLQYLADHDALTGLFNRRRFEQELVRETTAARRYGTHGAVLVLDLDNFKLVNDSLGHAAGDELISITGEVLRRRLRESDVLGRMGGDEFAVILSHADTAQSRQIGESLLEEIRHDTRASTASGSRRVTASVGIATFGPDDADLGAEDLLARADIAMYDAKEAGRDRVAVYDPGGVRHERMQHRVAWTDRIAIALEQDLFVIHAQPILSLEGRPERRYELLLRMVGEGGDLIPPGTFLYVAERSDLAQRIDRWVVRRAVDMLAEQQRQGRDVSFSINLSGRSVNDPEMLDFVTATIAGSGVNPARLTFEVTETAAIVNVARATDFAERLRAIGCSFALDDFGAGFASFYYLKHLSFDYLKIDGEFIKDLPSSRTNQLVVRSVVDIARGMGKQTIAEYVGDRRTVELLRGYGVDFAQGYYIGRPEPLDRVLARV